MNRRVFLTASTAAGSLATMGASFAQPAKGLKVLIPPTSGEQLSDLHAAAPGTALVQCGNDGEAVERVADADASFGFITPRLLSAGKSLRWVQQPSAGVEHVLKIPELLGRDIVLTNMQRVYGPEIADQAIGYLLAFTRSLAHFVRTQPSQEWRSNGPGLVLDELTGKTLLVIGLGGIGTEIARRAAAFGMRVLATDPKVLERPSSSKSSIARAHFTACCHGLTSLPARCRSRTSPGKCSAQESSRP